MTNSNPTPADDAASVNESQDPKSGENDSPKAVTGAIEAGWSGSVAGTNDALGPDGATDDPSNSEESK